MLTDPGIVADKENDGEKRATYLKTRKKILQLKNNHRNIAIKQLKQWD